MFVFLSFTLLFEATRVWATHAFLNTWFMFVLLTFTIPRSLFYSGYEYLTAILVKTELLGLLLFWGISNWPLKLLNSS